MLSIKFNRFTGKCRDEESCLLFSKNYLTMEAVIPDSFGKVSIEKFIVCQDLLRYLKLNYKGVEFSLLSVSNYCLRGYKIISIRLHNCGKIPVVIHMNTINFEVEIAEICTIKARKFKVVLNHYLEIGYEDLDKWSNCLYCGAKPELSFYNKKALAKCRCGNSYSDRRKVTLELENLEKECTRENITNSLRILWNSEN